MIQKAVIAPWVENSGICKEIKVDMIQKLKYRDQEIRINKKFSVLTSRAILMHAGWGPALSRTQYDAGGSNLSDGQNYTDRCKHKECISLKSSNLNFYRTDNSHTQNSSMVGR